VIGNAEGKGGEEKDRRILKERKKGGMMGREGTDGQKVGREESAGRKGSQGNGKENGEGQNRK
jgi:hypothetical protein